MDIIERTPEVPDPSTYIPHVDVKMYTLSVNLHNQISNDMVKTEERLNELLHDGDFSLVTTRTWMEMG